MDIETIMEKMTDEVEQYCAQNYSGKSIDHIFAITAAESSTHEDATMRFFHEYCFRFVLQQTLEKMMQTLTLQGITIERLQSEMAKMATIIDIMNQDGASK